ncbi:MAG: sigma-70 family RNA polymerase sigma factor [Fuerstiella sp.]|nr:sigma-70 family RNA polymerase sigma factor [Fuerstiella sp.]
MQDTAASTHRTSAQVYPTLDNLPDNQLIPLSVEGSLEAFDVLVVRYQDRLVHSLTQALGSRDDALEIAQQAFVSAWRRLDSFRQDAAFYSWLYRIAMNAAISRKRQEHLSTTSLDNYVATSGQSPVDQNVDTNPERQLVSQEHVQLVQTALGKLAEEFRQPLVLKEIDGFSYDEIATILEIPIGTVRSRIFRARRELTEQLKRLFPE